MAVSSEITNVIIQQLRNFVRQYSLQTGLNYEQWKSLERSIKRILKLEIKTKFIDKITRPKIERGNIYQIKINDIVDGVDVEFGLFISRYGISPQAFWYDKVKILDLIIAYDENKLKFDENKWFGIE